MNRTTLENFRKLSPDKQDQIISFLLKLLTDYQLLFSVQD